VPGWSSPSRFFTPTGRVPPLAAACVCLALLGGCDGGGGADGASGESATPPDPAVPQRIVSLTPALTEILFALDLGERVVGVTRFCDYPAEAAERPKVGGYVNPSVEAILALEPDAVFVSPNTGNRDSALSVERAGARLVVVDADDLADTFTAIETVARVCGVERRGAELIARVRERLDAASAALAGAAPVPVLFCVQLDPIIGVGGGTLPAELLELAGGRNVIEADGYPRLGIETVIEEAPRVILQARMDTDDPDADRQVLDYWSRWSSIPAVSADRVHVFDGTTALRPGPRVADAVEMLAGLLHPDAGEPGGAE
jgi:iron complex transport system substrate-binding protein